MSFQRDSEYCGYHRLERVAQTNILALYYYYFEFESNRCTRETILSGASSLLKLMNVLSS